MLLESRSSEVSASVGLMSLAVSCFLDCVSALRLHRDDGWFRFGAMVGFSERSWLVVGEEEEAYCRLQVLIGEKPC